MFVLRDYHDRINGFLGSRSRKAFVAAWALLAAALAALAAIFFWMGAPAINGVVPDVPLFLDGAWRMLHGQTPHKDFYWYIGDLPFYVAYLGMKLGRPGVSAITCGNVFVMVGAGLAAMTVLRRRASAFYTCLFSLFLALLAVTPRTLGDPYDYTSYAMMYNRYGEAFLALLGTVLFLTPDPALKNSWADWLEAGFAGFCLPLLLFCKLNYFAVGVGFFALACLRGRFPVKQALFVLASAAAFLALALILTKIPFSVMCGDYRIMLAAQKPGVKFHALALLLAKNLFLFPILFLLAWETSRTLSGPQKAWPHFLLIAAVFGGELALVASNYQSGELPLLALAALYGAETIRRQTGALAAEGFFMAVRNSGAALLLLFFLLPTLAADLKTIRYSAQGFANGWYIVPDTLRSTRLSDFRFASPGTRLAEMREYMAMVDEGMRLLRRHETPQMRLAVFLFSNPYHLALGVAPARGGMVCWHPAGITKRSHPPLKRMLGDATHILTEGNCAYITGIYGADWDALRLEVVEQTKNFTLFKVPEARENNP
jgi:hypothetical protein